MRARLALADLFRNYPWIGWAGWTIFCVVALARVHPRRFAAALGYYLDGIHHLQARDPLYDAATLTDVNYWPSTLVVLYPMIWVEPTVAATVVLILSAILMSLAAVWLMKALSPANAEVSPVMLAGLLLVLNVPACWYNFKNGQMQVPMTAAMMAACAMMAWRRWLASSLWLFAAIMIKPLALVMVLLSGALCRPMRWMLILVIVAGAVFPFAFIEAGYLVDQYHGYYYKLWHIATAPPAQWIYQADFSTMLAAAGVVLPGEASLVVRIAASLGTLWLGFRVQQTCSNKALALAIFVLSGCYLTLFGPRNEDISFLVLTPSITVIALLMLMKNDADYRAWLLIAAAMLLGFVIELPVDRVLKPAITMLVYVWVTAQMAVPRRWAEIVGGEGGRAPALLRSERTG